MEVGSKMKVVDVADFFDRLFVDWIGVRSKIEVENTAVFFDRLLIYRIG